MDLNQTPLFVGLTKRLDWLGRRTRVLAENMANADTPDYQARDLARPTFRELLRGASSGLAMARTDPGHIAPAAGAARGGAKTVTGTEAFATTPAGNSVVLEEQMMKLAETQLDHQLTLNLYRKNMGLLRIALGRGR